MKHVIEVFWRFLWLGCISFGGPAAHISYFRATFVQQLRWLNDEDYANLIALSQFLPGPSSSQIGFALGLKRAGLLGGIAAFLGFTLPSFLLLFTLASAMNTNHAGAKEWVWLTGIISGLKLLAVVIVADASLAMFKAFCRTRLTITIAVLTAISLWLLPSLWTQLAVLISAAGICAFSAAPHQPRIQYSPIRVHYLALGIFISLLIGLPFLTWLSDTLGLFDQFFRAGSLVFGGGHVVLPLLQQMLADSLSTERFLMAYATAQAVPGPMFTIATFLGASLTPDTAFLGALLATLGIFLPGFLLIISLQNAWTALAERPRIAGAMIGINAAVVGLLLAALYSPVFISAVNTHIDMALVALGYLLLTQFRLAIVGLVAFFAIAGLIM